jgi:hypothetical protein
LAAILTAVWTRLVVALHFLGDIDHFVEARRDQAGEADDAGVLLPRRVEDLRRRNHHPQIDHLIVVALEHDADDVLADVVDVALDGGHHHLAVGLPLAGLRLRFHERQQVGDRLLHHPCAFHHLRQEHLAGPEQVADDVHAVHQRPLDHVERPRGLLARLLHVRLDELGNAVHEGVSEPLRDILLPPAEIHLAHLAGAPELIGDFQQPLGGVGAAVENDVLYPLLQFLRDLLVDGDLAGVDDAHVHAGGDSVVEEHRMHRLAQGVVAAKRERDVGNPAGNEAVRQVLLDPPRRLEERDGVTVMLLDPGRDREDVGIEDDILGREADLVDKEPVGTLTDLELPVGGVSLALLVERHDNRGGAVALDLEGMTEKFLFALLQADGVDDPLALHALQARLDHRPLR